MRRIPRTPEYRFLAVILASTAGFLFALLAAAVLVDPYGIFGLRLVKPIVLTNRSEKLAFLRAMDPPPRAIILGSSRVFIMDPGRVEWLTGLRTFNASVSYARPEEYLAMTKYVIEELRVIPDLIVVGVNVGELNHDPVDAQTVTNRDLSRYLPISRKVKILTLFKVLKERFGPRMVRDVGVALFYRARGYPEERVTFLPNGMQDVDRARPSDPAKVTRTVPAAARLFAGETELSRERKRYLADFVSFADARGIGIRIAILPMPPESVAALERETNYPRLREELISFLKVLSDEHRNLMIFDATDISSYGGDPGGFNDATHPNADTIDRITDALLSDYR